MSDAILELKNVRKSYGAFEAVRGVSLSVQRGEMFGLLGPNGAGKTTLLSMVACLLERTSGEIVLDGQALDPGNLAQRPVLGIGTQDLAVYPDLTARENLHFFGKLYGLRGAELAKRVDEVLAMTALGDKASERVQTYSGGMKRRLNLGVAIVHRPKLLLLDEPTTGVDPQSRNHIFEQVKELNRQGMTIIYTSHYMEEVQTLCPRIAIIDHGRLIACDMLEGLLALLPSVIDFEVQGDAGGLVAAGERMGIAVCAQGPGRYRASAPRGEALQVAVYNLLHQQDLTLTAMTIRNPTLETVFLQLTEKTLRD